MNFNLIKRIYDLKELKSKIELKIELLEIENINLKTTPAESLSTSELVEILKEREGVSFLELENDSRMRMNIEGPIKILQIID